MTAWEELERRCMACQRCALADTRTNVVFGAGQKNAEIMFIGEGPGEHEDLQGEPSGFPGIKTSTSAISSNAARQKTGIP